MSAVKTFATLLLAVTGVGVLGACEQILRATSPDRHVDHTIDCSSGECVCKEGLGDCDGNEDNGCETSLAGDPKNCGGCGFTCTNAECVGTSCACNTGFGDCDGNENNGCETDTTKDPHNCGACHVDCGQGTCVGGFCTVSTLGSVTGASSLLASFGYVYVGTCGGSGSAVVYFIPGHGGSMPAVNDKGCAHAIAAAGVQIAWTSDTAILVNGIGSPGDGTPVATIGGPSPLLAATDSSVYWWDKPTDPTQHALKRAPLMGGGAPEILAKGELTALAAGFLNAYWSDQAGLHGVPHMGTTVTDLAAVQATALATDDDNVYAGSAAGIQAIPVAGGSPTVLAPATDVVGLAVAGSDVYWADRGDGTLRRVPIAGGTATVLATKQAFPAGVPISIDGSSVYWLSGTEVRSVGR